MLQITVATPDIKPRPHAGPLENPRCSRQALLAGIHSALFLRRRLLFIIFYRRTMISDARLWLSSRCAYASARTPFPSPSASPPPPPGERDFTIPAPTFAGALGTTICISKSNDASLTDLCFILLFPKHACFRYCSFEELSLEMSMKIFSLVMNGDTCEASTPCQIGFIRLSVEIFHYHSRIIVTLFSE